MQDSDQRQQSIGESLPPYTSHNASMVPSVDGSMIDIIANDGRQTSTSTDDRDWPSDWRAYGALVGGFLLMFNSWGIVNAYGTFLSFYQEQLLPTTDILLLNLVGSTQCFVILLFSLVVGRLLDAGYSRYLTISGSAIVVLGMCLISVVDGGGSEKKTFALLWLVQGLVIGIGMACFFVTSSQVVATWFTKKKGFAIGIVATGASIAGLVYPIMLRFLIDKHGFNTAVRYLTLLTALTSLPTILVARPSPSFPVRKPPSWLKLRVWLDTAALRYPPFLLFTAAIATMFLGFYGIFFNLEEWAARTNVAYKATMRPSCPTTMSMNAQESACVSPGLRTYYLLAIMNAASSIGRLSSSYLTDRFGALNVHASVTLVSALLCFFLWTFAKTLQTAIAFAVLFGAFSGSVIGLPPASMAAILGSGRQDRLGQWTGMMYSCATPFALVGPVVEGYLLTRFGYNFVTIQCFSGACLLLSAGLMVAARMASGRQNNSTADPEKRDGRT